MARLVASIYGVCVVALVVRVQVNLVSRYVHLDKLIDDESKVSLLPFAVLCLLLRV